MESLPNPSARTSSKCLVTTGVFSSRHLINTMSDLTDSETYTYSCCTKEDINSISAAGSYYVHMDLSDELDDEVIFDLFNHLIPLNAPIHVIVTPKPVPGNNDNLTAFLEKLNRHGFLTLEIRKESNSMDLAPEKNVVFFTGPGNTGKTSTISSLCEYFRSANQRTALIDITKANKLINYFPEHKLLSLSTIKELSGDKEFCKSVNMYSDGMIDLFVYDYENKSKQPSVIFFCELIRKFTQTYDYVLINTDETAVENTPNIFKIAAKIFVVHDFLPNKINKTKKLLMGLMKAGVDTQSYVSLIYNKTLKNSVDLGRIEEKLLLVKLPSKKIIPVVDINCNTFEIPFEKKTMEAIVRNLALKQTGIDETTLKYKTSISNIYRYINGIEYTENDEREIAELLKSSLHNILHSKKINKFSTTLSSSINQLKSNDAPKAIVQKTKGYLLNAKKNSTEFFNKHAEQLSNINLKLKASPAVLEPTEEE